MSLILAVDIGTGSAKLLALDSLGQVHHASRVSYQTLFPASNFAEQQPDAIAEAVWKLIRECPEKVKQEVLAISFSCVMHSIMAVDRHGKPLTPLMIWSDLRSRKQSIQLHDQGLHTELHTNTGTPVHPMSPLCKLMWMRDELPAIFHAANKFIGIKEYIWYKLFGVFEIDQGLASATGLMKILHKEWYKPALDLAGIDDSKLSEIVSVYHSRNMEASDKSLLLNLPGMVKAVIGSSDGCLANLGSDAMSSDKLAVTIGTSGAVRRTITSSSGQWAKHGLFCYHLDEDHLIEGGASNNGTAVLNWYLENMLNEGEGIDEFMQKGFGVNAGAEGLTFLPYVMGERSPFYNPDASGAFLGIRHHHQHNHFRRALLEGIIYTINLMAEKISECSGPYGSIVASGGFTQSPAWVQMLADVTGKNVQVQTHEDASAIGAGMLGFKALNIPYTMNHVPVSTFTPDPRNHLVYADAFHLFRQQATYYNTSGR